VLAGDEREDTSFAVHCPFAAVRGQLDAINGTASEAIDRVEHLERADEVELVDG
jgi:hypothetical protein